MNIELNQAANLAAFFILEEACGHHINQIIEKHITEVPQLNNVHFVVLDCSKRAFLDMYIQSMRCYTSMTFHTVFTIHKEELISIIHSRLE